MLVYFNEFHYNVHYALTGMGYGPFQQRLLCFAELLPSQPSPNREFTVNYNRIEGSIYKKG
jgi:hypothetical protein